MPILRLLWCNLLQKIFQTLVEIFYNSIPHCMVGTGCWPFECDFSSSCAALDKITADSLSCGLSVIADAVVDSWCCLFIVQLNGAACSDDDTAGMNRRLTFYRLCDRLASKLQSLFVPLVGQLIKDVCRVLKQTTEGSAIVHSQPWYCTSWLHILSVSKIVTNAILMLCLVVTVT